MPMLFSNTNGVLWTDNEESGIVIESAITVILLNDFRTFQPVKSLLVKRFGKLNIAAVESITTSDSAEIVLVECKVNNRLKGEAFHGISSCERTIR